MTRSQGSVGTLEEAYWRSLKSELEDYARHLAATGELDRGRAVAERARMEITLDDGANWIPAIGFTALREVAPELFSPEGIVTQAVGDLGVVDVLIID
jgi:hypothetical protein